MKEKKSFIPRQRFQKICLIFLAAILPKKVLKFSPFFKLFFFFGQTLSKPTTWQLRIEPLKQGEIERERMKEKKRGNYHNQNLRGIKSRLLEWYALIVLSPVQHALLLRIFLLLSLILLFDKIGTYVKNTFLRLVNGNTKDWCWTGLPKE